MWSCLGVPNKGHKLIWRIMIANLPFFSLVIDQLWSVGREWCPMPGCCVNFGDARGPTFRDQPTLPTPSNKLMAGFANHGEVVGGWTNPSEEYSWIISPTRGENKKIFEVSPPSERFFGRIVLFFVKDLMASSLLSAPYPPLSQHSWLENPHFFSW